MKPTVLFLCLFFALNSICIYRSNAQEKDDPGKWTPEDIINTEFLRSAVFSPDGTMVIWSKTKGDKEKDKFISDLYLTRLNKLEDGMPHTVQLTQEDETDYSPAFSEDNSAVYFLSSREKGKKLWKISVFGGEASSVHEFKNGISNIQLAGTNTIFFIGNEGETLREKELQKKKDDVVIVEDSVYWKPNRVFTFDLKNKTISRVTTNEKPINFYSVSPNGKWLVYRMQQSPHFPADAQPDPSYFLKNLTTGKVTQILMDFNFPCFNFNFTEDESGMYFISSHASDPEWNGAGVQELYYFDLKTGNPKKVDLNWENGIGNGYFIAGNDILVTLANKATYKNAVYTPYKNDWKQKFLDFGKTNEHIDPIAVSKDGKMLLYGYSTASTLPVYFIGERKGPELKNQKTFVKLNTKLAEKRLTRSEVITWEGYNGDEVNGILYYPENYVPGKKYPLILSIHGGPAGVDTDQWSERWSTYPNIFAQKGAFVLKPNYHGSSNHGLGFVESIKKNYYVPELDDITKGIKMLVDKGMVDTDKLGTMGWSNGAIITTMLTVKYPDMFKVAAAGAGDVNWTSDFGTCQFGVSFDQSYFGGAPWDDMNGTFYNENYIIKSPLFELDKVKTPTIIFHGSEDRAVPRDQGWEYYRALQQIGQAPVKFLWFPGQPHGLGKISHQLRKMEEEINWIDTYLFKTYEPDNVAFKEDSPLGNLLKKQKTAIVNGMYGIMEKNILIPETVPFKKDTTAIGRFEVTHAQYQSFKKEHTFEPGKQNHPVQLSFKDALAYVEWLSKTTGENYRLPNKEEALQLHKKALKSAQKENTLTYWAGYDITIDEVNTFKNKFKDLTKSLLMEVGSFAPLKIENEELYDLGGNLSEYASNGLPYGFSAYDFADPAEDKSIASEYSGLRVIKQIK